MLGPNPEDAMNESLTDDAGNVTAQMAFYFTNNYTSPHIVSAGFESYTAGSYAPGIYNAYVTTSNNTQIPWIGKYEGTGFLHPETGAVLSAATGDISTHSPFINSNGLVFRFKVPTAGSWELHDSFAMPTRETQRIVALSVIVRSSDGSSNTTVVP
eukprot:1074017-Pleurochrysis_carterae.AAC.1